MSTNHIPNPFTRETSDTRELLSSAVNNTTFFSRKGFLDRLFTKWFDRLVYPQIWEDPRVDIEALQLNEHSRIFTISSGGCNVLNYLTINPQAIEVVDLNEAHVALLKLKLAAVHHLPSQEAFFDFFARANLNKNIDRYEAYIRPHLDQRTLEYWESKEYPWGKKRIYYFAKGFYRYGLLGNFIGLIHWVCKKLGYDISKVMQARTLSEQQTLFNQHVAPVFETRLIKFLCNRPVVMYSLGIPPAQFAEMEQESKVSQQGMHHLLQERARKLACDFPICDNYFAWQAFGREYDTHHRKALPAYLQQNNFAKLEAGHARVEVNHTSMTERLKSLPNQSLTSYLFLDAQDWMDEQQLSELWQQVNRTAKPGARVVFRTAGIDSPLENKLPKQLLSHWHTNLTTNQALTAKDRSAIYGGVHLYTYQPEKTQP